MSWVKRHNTVNYNLMLRRKKFQQNRPIDAKYSASSIGNVIGDAQYLRWASEQTKAQEYWRTPEYVKTKASVLVTNINPGDFFNAGTENRQIGIVSAKVTVYGRPAYADDLLPSCHPTHEEYIRYECAGEMGGYLGDIWHQTMIRSHFVWLPLPFQLMLIGFEHEAGEAQDLISSIVASSNS